VRALENVVVGPVIAVLSFVCSVGNVPLAAVLWSGGISFGGVMAFIFADLIVLPIIAVYRKYYGTEFAVRITLLMFATMVVAALAVDGLFSVLGLVPSVHPSRGMIFEPVGLDYKLVANVLAGVVFAALFALTVRRGATDPICGMRVDRAQAVRVRGRSGVVHLCSAGCAARFAASEEAESRHGEETDSLEPPASSSTTGGRAALPR
jgi:YHS domain-containing protein